MLSASLNKTFPSFLCVGGCVLFLFLFVCFCLGFVCCWGCFVCLFVIGFFIHDRFEQTFGELSVYSMKGSYWSRWFTTLYVRIMLVGLILAEFSLSLSMHHLPVACNQCTLSSSTIVVYHLFYYYYFCLTCFCFTIIFRCVDETCRKL